MSLYSQRGVSAQKEDVHKATEKLDKGLYPYAFCKIYEDYLTRDKDWVNLMHADGAGTKSILAYLYWKETGDISVWRGIAQDAIVMNLDDLLCVGIYDNLLFSSTIDRNKSMIPGEVLNEIIDATQKFFEEMKRFDVHIEFLGGETADVGDLVRTIAVNGTMTARWPKEKLITNEKISAGDVIVGFSSAGQATYESFYNSGIGSNGLTSARHDVLDKTYARKFPESFESSLSDQVVYIGSKKMTDTVTFDHGNKTITTSIGQLLLSPTRTYAPFVTQLLTEHFEAVHGMIHCSGGGQTKCMKYLHSHFKITKDNLFSPPEIFKLIQLSSGADNREMYQVFNMGHRLEVFTDDGSAVRMIELAESFDIEAQVVGRVEAAVKKELIIDLGGQQISYLS
jgi:phosphoribosylformylglycinamidine cyclo-ligase